MSYEKIPGWMAPEFETFYEAMAERLPSSARIVEVGCAYGRSIAFLCERFVALGKSPSIYAVDTWDEFMGGEQPDKAEFVACMKRNHRTPLEAFHANILEFSPVTWRSIFVAQGESVHRARSFENASLDLVMIDARHEYDNVKADIAAWRPKVKRGGLIAGDDYDPAMFPGLVRAVDEFASSAKKLRVQHQGRVWFHEVSK